MKIKLTSKRRPERISRGQTGKGTPITDAHQRFVKTMLSKIDQNHTSARELSDRIGRTHAYVAKIANLECRPSRSDATAIMDHLQFNRRDRAFFLKQYIYTLKDTRYRIPKSLQIS